MRAHVEAADDDPDPSYITQAYLDDMEANAEEVESPGEGAESLMAAGNLMYDVTFLALRYSGRRDGENYICGGNLGIQSRWRQPSIFGRCQESKCIDLAKLLTAPMTKTRVQRLLITRDCVAGGRNGG
jgi:hypothetical protein